jgi:hypothetical protein
VCVCGKVWSVVHMQLPSTCWGSTVKCSAQVTVVQGAPGTPVAATVPHHTSQHHQLSVCNYGRGLWAGCWNSCSSSDLHSPAHMALQLVKTKCNSLWECVKSLFEQVEWKLNQFIYEVCTCNKISTRYAQLYWVHHPAHLMAFITKQNTENYKLNFCSKFWN